MRILLTGGTGYIGSHTALAVVAAGHEPVLLDSLANSWPSVAKRLEEIVGRPLTLVETRSNIEKMTFSVGPILPSGSPIRC